jgi:hypothetical protein
MGRKNGTYGGEEKSMQIWWINTEERYHLEDLCGDKRTLKRIMSNKFGRMWVAFI